MKELRKFVEFTNVTKRTADSARAKSLKKEAQQRIKFLNNITKKIGIHDENANYIVENSYDILLELIRAKMHLKGLKASGEGAHEAEVAYLFELGFIEDDVEFLNEMRYIRNGILYYGHKTDENYAQLVIKFLDRTYPILL